MLGKLQSYVVSIKISVETHTGGNALMIKEGKCSYCAGVTPVKEQRKGKIG